MSRLAINYGRVTRPTTILGVVNCQRPFVLATNSIHTALMVMFAPLKLQLENKYGRLTSDTPTKRSMEHGLVSASSRGVLAIWRVMAVLAKRSSYPRVLVGVFNRLLDSIDC